VGEQYAAEARLGLTWSVPIGDHGGDAPRGARSPSMPRRLRGLDGTFF
jgi:hypothetical protein